MSAQDQQSVKLPTPLLERVAGITEQWTKRDGGIVRWTRAMVLDLVMLRGLEACEQTTTGGQNFEPNRPPRVVKSTTTGGLGSKVTRARARTGAHAAASAGGNKNTSLPPEPTSGTAPKPAPDRVHQENQAPATPARDERAHARNESPVTTPVIAAGGPRTGAEVQFIPPGPSPEEDAEIIARGQERMLAQRAQVRADEEARAARKAQAGIEHRARLEADRARMEAYYAAHPEGRGAPL